MEKRWMKWGEKRITIKAGSNSFAFIIKSMFI